MLNTAIKGINQCTIDKLFGNRRFNGHQLFGIAELAIVPDKNMIFPYMPDKGEFVGLDDRYPVVSYHRVISAAITQKGQGYGNEAKKEVIRFNMMQVIFQNEEVTKLSQSDLFMYVKAAYPDAMKIENFDYISVVINSVILNSQQVFRAEFQNIPYNLNPKHSLMAISYTIESEYRKSCFNSCPEL